MSAAKSNKLIKVLVFVLFLAVVFIVVVAMGRNKNEEEIQTNPQSVIYLSEQEQKDLGITAGDTPHDTIKTLLGALKETRADVKKVLEENERLKQEKQNLTVNSENVDLRINQALENQRNSLFSEFEARLENLTSALKVNRDEGVSSSTPSAGQPTNDALPIGGSLFKPENGGGSTTVSDSNIGNAVASDGMRWVSPADLKMTDKQGNLVADTFQGEKKASFPNPFKALDESPLGDAATTAQNGFKETTNDRTSKTRTPYFTVPENSTLMGSVAMTALLGRIPIDGSVSDPYPFKIMIGRENLIANGIELPDVEGAIVSGTANGDWALSCVRGDVKSITFVFNDGRIAKSRTDNKNSNNEQTLGWLSNPQGVPCIPGERKTNAPEYLTTQFLLSGAGAAAQGFSQSQTTTVVDSGSVVGAVTGNAGKYILGQAIGGGLSEMEDWVRKRFGQTFDAVYVPPGQAVAVHITRDLDIDYDTEARKVKYRQTKPNRQLD